MPVMVPIRRTSTTPSYRPTDSSEARATVPRECINERFASAAAHDSGFAV